MRVNVIMTNKETGYTQRLTLTERASGDLLYNLTGCVKLRNLTTETETATYTIKVIL